LPPTSGVVQLFADSNYQGVNATLDTAGDYNIERLQTGGSVGNDTVSSLLIAPGQQVTVYADANFAGSSKTFIQDTPYVGDDFNDNISSLKVSPISGGGADTIVRGRIMPGNDNGLNVVALLNPAFGIHVND
jgi:hypothetical protein